jgi:hypothetical protein
VISFLKDKDDCSPCATRRPDVKPKKAIGLFTGIVLALLPKCPFCFMAFSGTVMLCGPGSITQTPRTFSSLPALYLTVFFCLIILLSIFFNYRGSRTRQALGIAALGMALLIWSILAGGGEILYYSGVLTIFSGVWLNGSLLSVAANVKKEFLKHKKI